MKKRNITASLPGSLTVVQVPGDAALLHGVVRMGCTQRDLAVPDMMGQKAAYRTQNATSTTTFTDGVGRLAVGKGKTRRSYYTPPCARNAMLK